MTRFTAFLIGSGFLGAYIGVNAAMEKAFPTSSSTQQCYVTGPLKDEKVEVHNCTPVPYSFANGIFVRMIEPLAPTSPSIRALVRNHASEPPKNEL